MIDSSKEKLFGWKDPSFHGGNVWQGALRELPSLSQPISLGSRHHTLKILLRPLAKPVHFTIRKSAKVRNAWKPTNTCFLSSLQP